MLEPSPDKWSERFGDKTLMVPVGTRYFELIQQLHNMSLSRVFFWTII